MNGNMSMNNGNQGSSFTQWGMQAVQNAYARTSNAISKACIKKNSVKLKYGSFVYLVNGREKKISNNQKIKKNEYTKDVCRHCGICSLYPRSFCAADLRRDGTSHVINEQVTTVITATEPIRFVDISTDKIAGDQPINNTIRLKPKEGAHEDGEVLAIVTIVTERYRSQYALLLCQHVYRKQ